MILGVQGVNAAQKSGAVAVPGFTDAHAHLLRQFSGIPFPWQETTVARFHQQVASRGTTPMDVAEPPPAGPLAAMAARLRAGLDRAAAAGLVEITEMGMRAWWYADALALLQEQRPLPVRVRVYLASGLAEQTTLAELGARRSGTGPWVSLDGIKFYADGWLGPRTCAMCQPFSDLNSVGLLFMDAAALARRIGPFAANGWRIATHAIGDRGIATVLDAYQLVWGSDLAAAAPRVEHASVQSRDLAARMAESGVVACLQPSFAVTDVAHVRAGLGPQRQDFAYPWRDLAAAGARLLAGSDYPIEIIEPLPGLARLVNGRSERPGCQTAGSAPASCRLDAATAFALHSDKTAGQTLLSADPRDVASPEIDLIEVHGTVPVPFSAGS
jgi:predicted amidohydrolase YtcJ